MKINNQIFNIKISKIIAFLTKLSKVQMIKIHVINIKVIKINMIKVINIQLIKINTTMIMIKETGQREKT